MDNPSLRMKFASYITLLLDMNFLAHADWKQWRGPTVQGHAKAKLPIKWSETENVTWRTSIPGKGWSSPVIEKNQIWFTTAFETPASEAETKKRLKENKIKIHYLTSWLDVYDQIKENFLEFTAYET